MSVRKAVITEQRLLVKSNPSLYRLGYDLSVRLDVPAHGNEGSSSHGSGASFPAGWWRWDLGEVSRRFNLPLQGVRPNGLELPPLLNLLSKLLCVAARLDLLDNELAPEDAMRVNELSVAARRVLFELSGAALARAADDVAQLPVPAAALAGSPLHALSAQYRVVPAQSPGNSRASALQLLLYFTAKRQARLFGVSKQAWTVGVTTAAASKW